VRFSRRRHEKNQREIHGKKAIRNRQAEKESCTNRDIRVTLLEAGKMRMEERSQSPMTVCTEELKKKSLGGKVHRISASRKVVLQAGWR